MSVIASPPHDLSDKGRKVAPRQPRSRLPVDQHPQATCSVRHWGKQTARRILRNAEKSRVELGATVRRIPLAKWLLLTVRAED